MRLSLRQDHNTGELQGSCFLRDQLARSSGGRRVNSSLKDQLARSSGGRKSSWSLSLQLARSIGARRVNSSLRDQLARSSGGKTFELLDHLHLKQHFFKAKLLWCCPSATAAIASGWVFV
jgi:hypothetical protein